MIDDLPLGERIASAIEARLSYVLARRAELLVPRDDPASDAFRKGHDSALREAARIARETPDSRPGSPDVAQTHQSPTPP